MNSVISLVSDFNIQNNSSNDSLLKAHSQVIIKISIQQTNTAKQNNNKKNDVTASKSLQTKQNKKS